MFNIVGVSRGRSAWCAAALHRASGVRPRGDDSGGHLITSAILKFTVDHLAVREVETTAAAGDR